MAEPGTERTETTAGDAGQATRERLLDVAERLFAEQGFAGTSVRAITAEAGCNLAAINYHFGGKEQLYQEVFRRRLTVIREQRLGSIRHALEAASGPASLETLLRAFATAFFEPFVESGGQLWMKLSARELLELHLPEGMFRTEIITPVHEELVAALIPACPGLDSRTARLCTHSLVGQMVHFMRFERSFGSGQGERPGGFPLPELVDHIVRFSAAGIRAAAACEEHREG